MVVTQTANSPIQFSGQTAAYGSGVAVVYNDKKIVVSTNSIQHNSGTNQYTSSDGITYTPA